ncbi:MAG: ATP-binding protein [Holophaga sp.]|nr:ATP-binding protein [Holophaga sp.]
MAQAVDAKVLGQILLVESLVARLPNKASMFQFVARGLEEVPGVGRIWFQETPVAAVPGTRSFEIRHDSDVHAVLNFEVLDEASFAIHEPYLQNLAFMLGLVLDERIQRERNQHYSAELEALVEARTQALAASESRARSMLRGALDGVLLVDADGHLLELNDAACSMLGYRRDELLAMRLDEIQATGGTEAFQAHLARVREKGHDLSEAQHRRKDGTGIDAEVSATFLEEQNQFVVFIRDVTERKRAAEENARLQAQLQQAQKMESLGTLSGGIAHDMNNVLGAILGLASANVEVQPKGSPAHRAFETIATAATRGGEMVRRLLAFAHHGPTQEQVLDANALLQEEVRLLERTTLAKVDLVMDLEPGLHALRGDAGALSHALMNLCVNAVDAMPEQGRLTLRTRNLDPGWVAIEVEDTGTGMSREVLDRAMDPFFTTKGVGQGTGLGLSMVYSTVKAHHGQIEIHSQPGCGTRVRLRFPACGDGPCLPEAEAEPRPAASPAALKTLLVDDDELVQSSVEAMLEALGHAVAVSSSGEEALARIESGFTPDLVILDLNMPGLGGSATLCRIHALLPEVPVLLSTGRVDQTALNLATADPFVILLPKPYTFQEFKQCLGQFGR